MQILDSCWLFFLLELLWVWSDLGVICSINLVESRLVKEFKDINLSVLSLQI